MAENIPKNEEHGQTKHSYTKIIELLHPCIQEENMDHFTHRNKVLFKDQQKIYLAFH